MAGTSNQSGRDRVEETELAAQIASRISSSARLTALGLSAAIAECATNVVGLHHHSSWSLNAIGLNPMLTRYNLFMSERRPGVAAQPSRRSGWLSRNHFNSPLIRFPIAARAVFSETRRFSTPRSTSSVRSWSVTSTVPFMGVLSKPNFALSEKLSIDPCQLFCCTTSRTGSPATPWNTSLNERSTDSMISALERSCEIVIRMSRPVLMALKSANTI